MKHRIVIVDDHKIVIDGLRSLLEKEPDLEVVGEATTGQMGAWLIAHHKPDIALVDIRLGDISGLEVCRYAQEASPQTKVIILSGYFQSDLVHQALQAGAKGYLIKDAEYIDLVTKVRRVLAGELAFDPRVTHTLVEYVVNHPPAETDPLLSPREMDVLRLMAQGLTNSEIADQLHLSPATVKDYVRNIMTKLEARNRVDAVTRAVRMGLI